MDGDSGDSMPSAGGEAPGVDPRDGLERAAGPPASEPPPASRHSDTPDRSDSPDRPDAAWFESVVEAAGHAIFMADTDGVITYVNPAFEGITGYAADEVIGRTPDVLNSGYHDADYFARLWETITAGEVWREEVVNRRKDGRRYVANQTIAPVLDPRTGTIEQFVAVQTDVTERRAHERALERSRDLLRRTETLASVGGWQLDVETERLRWTAGTREIHGVDEDYEPSIDDALDFYHPDDRREVADAVERCRRDGTPYDLLVRILSADGRERWVKTRGRRVETGESVKIRGAILDVTDRKIHEQQLAVLHRVLRHNLRNDLNVIMGSAERLATRFDAAETDPAESDAATLADPAEVARGISEAAERLVLIAEQVRRFEHVYTRADRVETVDGASILQRVSTACDGIAPPVEVRGIDGETTVLGDAETIRFALEELVDHLVGNVDGTASPVSLELSAASPGRLSLGVAVPSSAVPGMDRRAIEDGEETPLVHGQGVRLWLVNWLMMALGGSLSFSDDDPDTTTVSIDLPRAT